MCVLGDVLDATVADLWCRCFSGEREHAAGKDPDGEKPRMS